MIGVLSGAQGMGRSLNETCWACSLLTAAEARKAHDEAIGGDGCWQEGVCHSRQLITGRVVAENLKETMN
ncbi:hypothetical protein H6G00_16855 [Leptolyngbya sp. FACHB-541]|uniref:hypothetical protein n=1 Tax=Leptolyngbya sp. FACHB-541 TaxID=2692810 RepID=UPI001683A4B4|nr:hypothetical protein [Leptolyngbya sp. FACHB-541]MBD1998277.1 hypothetical protein [Leptolyngbya sp. FACHB-541]